MELMTLTLLFVEFFRSLARLLGVVKILIALFETLILTFVLLRECQRTWV